MEKRAYLNSVFYDHSSDIQYYHSTPIIKRSIDMKCLETSIKKVKNINSYKIPKLYSKGFIINIHKKPDDYNQIDGFITKYLRMKNISFLNSKTGMTYNELGYIQFDLFSLIGIKVRKYLNKIKKDKTKYENQYRISKLYLWKKFTT